MTTRPDFTLTQLEYALAVLRYGHFAKAAEACHVTQPTLSMQVQKLEDLLGATLFDRSKKPVLTTDLGKKLLEQFQNTLSEAKRITELLDTEKKSKAHGKLNLGVIPTVAPYVIPRLIPMAKQILPEMELRITEMQTHQIIASLKNDDLEVGLLATPLNDPLIVEQHLYYEPFHVLCRKGHELAQMKKIKYADLKYPDIWLLSEGHCLRSQILDICSLRNDKTRPSHFIFESGSLETLKNLVDSSGGYTLLPHLASSAIGPQSKILNFESPIPSREIGLVFRRRQYKTALIQELGKAIVASLPPDMRNHRPKDLDILPIQ